jgi:ATP-dependent helicase/nuclease subunit B
VPAKTILCLGPAHSGKTGQLVRQYRAALQSGPFGDSADSGPPSGRKAFGRALWLAPNARSAEFVRRQLLDAELHACLQPGVVTFDQFSTQILDETRPRRHRISRLQQRELLRNIIHAAIEAEQLTRFAAAAGRDGFIDLLAAHIQELVHRDVTPAAYSKALPARGDVQRHNELAQLYTEYIRQLTEHGLFDLDTIHGAARDALAAGACRRWQNLELVVVDGFTDFTRTQHEILRLLGDRTKCLLISLPYDQAAPPMQRTSRDSDPALSAAAPLRPDLFAKVSATLSELRRRHHQLEIRRFAGRGSTWPALEHLAKNVFRRPDQIEPPSIEVRDSLDRLEIIEAAGAHDEIVSIARRIKRQLTAIPAAHPGDIVVVFRSLGEAAPRVREVFDQLGIPYYLDSEARLITAPVIKALMSLLRLANEDWPFRRVISVLTNNSFTALEDTARTAADWLVRDLQIAQGRGTLLERVELMAAEDATLPGGNYAARRAAMARAAKPILAQLAQALEQLPGEATLSEWSAALKNLAATLGLSPFDGGDKTGRAVDVAERDGEDSPPYDSIDLRAWQSVEGHFAALQRLGAHLHRPPRQVSCRELTGILLEVATHESLPRVHDEVGRVRILSAQSARNVSAPHFYVAGMSEQAFPASESAGRLATAADYRLAACVADGQLAASPIVYATRAQEEMLLFYEVLSRAGESLTISYPGLDEKAQKLPSSPYVLELERVLGGEAIRRTTPHLSPVPRQLAEAGPATANAPNFSNAAFSLPEWRVRAVADALAGERNLLAGVLSDRANRKLSAAIVAGLRIVDSRARGESFGPAEGVINSPAAAARLAKRFGPQHLWSPSQWETFAACPYKFFLESVLGLEPLGDLVLETDFARRGSRLHHVLAEFHRHWPQVRAARTLTAEEERSEFLDTLNKIIDERLAASPRGGIDAALVELDCRQIRKWAASHFQHHTKYAGAFSHLDSPVAPQHFEFRFGPSRTGDADHDPNSTTSAFVLDIDGEAIRVTGQIDRIDVVTTGGQTFFNVIDYKSSKKVSLKPEHIESGERLQLPIYVEAAQALVFNGEATPLAAGYWSMAGGFDAKGALGVVQAVETGDRWESLRATVRRLVGQFVGNIRHGDFPVASRDDKCTSYCEFSTVCRVTQVRNLNKTWPGETRS